MQTCNAQGPGWVKYCKTLNFGVWVNLIILDPHNFSVFASYYTETLLYSNFRSPLFSQTCQAREIKDTRKNGFYSNWYINNLLSDIRSYKLLVGISQMYKSDAGRAQDELIRFWDQKVTCQGRRDRMW